MDDYSAIERDKLLIHSTTEVDLRGIILHEKKQCAKDHMFRVYNILKVSKLQR